jgi:NTP pyrophosphatase (non-canonical NTP hydrolase)
MSTLSDLEQFLDSPTEQAEMARMLNKFALLCSVQADRSGFTREPDRIRGIIYEEEDRELYEWFRDCEIQAELARIGSEIGEAIEAIRKPAPDHHLPQFDNFIVELGDTLIRIGDTAGRRMMPLGEATVEKMIYNAKRAYKHGKNS